MMNLPLNVLFADKALSATRPLRMALRRRGAAVSLEATAADTVQFLKNHPTDLLVLDEEIQRDSDPDLVSSLSLSHPETEVILLHSGTDAIPHGSGLGLLFSARKPIAAGTLLDIIAAAFPGRLHEQTALRPEVRTVLCVDDDPVYISSLSRFLERQGYYVSSHGSSHRALEALEILRPELALVDIMMPGLDGLGLCQKIRESSKGRIPVVILTALDSDETFHRAHESGASICLSKACDPDHLLNIVDLIAGDLDEEERGLIRSRLGERYSLQT
jgi:DNA-binding response OmpR family regulator